MTRRRSAARTGVAVAMTLTIIMVLEGPSMRSQAVSTADIRSCRPLPAACRFLLAMAPPADRPHPAGRAAILANAGPRHVDLSTYDP
jgi:hypothetical protein